MVATHKNGERHLMFEQVLSSRLSPRSVQIPKPINASPAAISIHPGGDDSSESASKGNRHDVYQQRCSKYRTKNDSWAKSCGETEGYKLGFVTQLRQKYNPKRYYKSVHYRAAILRVLSAATACTYRRGNAEKKRLPLYYNRENRIYFLSSLAGLFCVSGAEINPFSEERSSSLK